MFKFGPLMIEIFMSFVVLFWVQKYQIIVLIAILIYVLLIITAAILL